MEHTEGYIDKVGSVGASDFKVSNIKGIFRNELEEHKEDLAEELQDKEKHKCKFYAYLIKSICSGLLLPLLDIGTDVATSVTHAKFENYGWSALTLVFVAVPGLVCGLAIAIKGLRKEVTAQRIVNFSIVVFAMPFLYPFIQIFVNGYMVYMIIHSGSHEVVKIMGHDVKQFKSLEGFLESGPQFVLQAYIILLGQKKGIDDFTRVEAKRLAILCLTTLISFASLTKTGCNVNKPDPDENRKAPQIVTSSIRFLLTSVPFHFFMTLFRVSCLAYFFAFYWKWTFLIIGVTILINVGILWSCKCSPTITVLLGTVSVFMPNGYLLYNFAATFLVDMTLDQTRRFFSWQILIVNILYLVLILISSDRIVSWPFELDDQSILSHTEIRDIIVLTIGIGGLISMIFSILHWKVSIRTLYNQEESQTTDVQVDEGNNEEQIELQ